MTLILENAHLQLKLHTKSSTFSVASRVRAGAEIHHARLHLYYRSGYRQHHGLHSWNGFSVGEPETRQTVHGPTRQQILQSGNMPGNIQVEVVFSLPEDHSLLFWQARIHNRGPHPIRLDRIEMLEAGFAHFSAQRLTEHHPRSRVAGLDNPFELAFFSNGWGSWDNTQVYHFSDRFRRTRLGPFTRPMRQNPGTPHPKRRGHFGSDMFGVLGNRAHRSGILLGFLSQKQHFGSLEALVDPRAPAVSLWANGDGAVLPPGQSISTDWACLYILHIDQPYPLAPYLEAVARENITHDIQFTRPVPTSGWCSWYHYFQDISAEKIRHNLAAANTLQNEIPQELFQIDDGFQAEIGDWLIPSPAFPGGITPLAEEIQSAGLIPGLWLAPFTVHPKSQLYRNHSNWLLKNGWGQPVNAGYNWGCLHTALDLTHPGALEYVAEVIQTAVHRWSFPYLKLDFLYAGALPGRHHDPTLSRAQIIRGAFEHIRRTAGNETILLGCGCPLGPGIGIFNSMRIGPDVAPTWNPQLFGMQKPFKQEPALPAVRDAVHNVLTRAPLHQKWWINDPDCLLIRPETELTLAEVQTQATVTALTGGPVLLSDDLAALPPDRLRIAQVLLPIIGQTPHILDWFDSPTPTQLQLDLNGPAGPWHLIALFNWHDKPGSIRFHPRNFYLHSQQPHHAREFWTGRCFQVTTDGIEFPNIPSHGTVLLALRSLQMEPVVYLGSNLHISQGQEITAWSAAQNQASFTLSRPGTASGFFDLALPKSPQEAIQDENALLWENLEAGIFRFHTRFKGEGRFRVFW